MRDPEYEAPPCTFCGGLDLHRIDCPTLVWDDSDDVPPFGTPPEEPSEPLPTCPDTLPIPFEDFDDGA